MKRSIVYYCHVAYKLQSESTLYNLLECLGPPCSNRPSIWSLGYSDRIRIHNHLVCNQKRSVCLNGWVHEPSGCGFGSCCCLLKRSIILVFLNQFDKSFKGKHLIDKAQTWKLSCISNYRVTKKNATYKNFNKSNNAAADKKKILIVDKLLFMHKLCTKFQA